MSGAAEIHNKLCHGSPREPQTGADSTILAGRGATRGRPHLRGRPPGIDRCGSNGSVRVKKVLIGLVAIVVILVVVVLVLPSIVPKDTLRAQIESQMESATGRDVTIAGDVGVSIIPSVELTLERVSIANAPGAADPNMVELGALRLKVGLFPLLGGELAVDEFVLDRPVIRLEVDAAGKPNWEFDTGASSSGARGFLASFVGRDRPAVVSKRFFGFVWQSFFVRPAAAADCGGDMTLPIDTRAAA